MSPILGSAAGAKAFGMFSVKGKATLGGGYWLKVLGVTNKNTSLSFGKPLFSSGAGAFFAGLNYSSGSPAYQVVKMTSSGEISWQRSYIAGTNNALNGIAVSAFNTVYLAGSGFYSYYASDALTLKYSSTGSLSWQRGHPVANQGDSTGSRSHVTAGICSDFYTGTELIYSAVSMQPPLGTSYTTGIIFSKYSASSGSAAGYSKLLAPSSASIFLEATGMDSSNNFGYIYTVGSIQDYSSSTNKDVLLIKYAGGTGAISWMRTIGAAATEGDGAKIAVDLSDNVYVSTPVYGGTNPGIEVLKIDYNGNLVWAKRVTTGVDYAFFPSNISVDSQEDVYVSGTHYTGGAKSFIIKLSSSDGSLIYQRSISIAGGLMYSSGATTSYNNSEMYVYGQTTSLGGYHAYAGKLPFDGSKTGTYDIGGTTMTYAATDYTITAGALSVSTTSGLVESSYTLPTPTAPGTSSTSGLTLVESV